LTRPCFVSKGPLGKLAAGISMHIGGIRPSELLREVDEKGVVGLLVDASCIASIMPKHPEGTLSAEIEDTYRRYGIPHGPNWQDSFADNH